MAKCSTGVGEATPTTLSSVMECGKEATIGWVKKNARYEGFVGYIIHNMLVARRLLNRLETFLKKKRTRMKILKDE